MDRVEGKVQTAGSVLVYRVNCVGYGPSGR